MMQKLSETALKQVMPAIDAIKKHPFNTQLANGTLDKSLFTYYIEQDTLYLKDFARSLALLAARVPTPYTKIFLSFSEGALIAEQEVVHQFFRDTLSAKNTGKLSPATLMYTSYLLRTCATEAVEIGIASTLPCFWIYNIIGQSILKQTTIKEKNPYWRWIETYASEDFTHTTHQAISIFDEMASTACQNTQKLMLDAFHKSTLLEWHFWNDAYHLKTIDDLTLFYPSKENYLT